MFERCDSDNRVIVHTAVDQAHARHHSWLGTEHLLLAFALHRDLLPDDVAGLLPDADAIATALTAAAGPGRRDADLLRTVGVDLDQVRSAVRETSGAEAVERLRRPVRQPWQPWRRPSRRCTSLLVDALSVAPRVKQAFERARRSADRGRTSLIDPSALLRGMIEVKEAMSNRLLRELGVAPEALAEVLDDRTR